MKTKIKQWRKLTGEYIKGLLDQEVQEVIDREIQNGHQIKVCIGTDSQVKGNNIEFATVVVFVRKGNGAFMYLNKETLHQRMNIKQRMLLEVNKSVEVAYFLSHIFSQRNIDMEVHVDINTQNQYKSYEALQEAMGYIKGMGFTFKAKPDAFASSSCANKVVN